MLKDFIFALLRPFLNCYVRLRFHDFWALKRHLQTHHSKLLELCYTHHFMRMGSFVGLGCHLENTPCFPHGARGVFLSSDCSVGKDAVIFQQVTIGSNTLEGTGHPGSPSLGDHVYIGAGAKIIGGITVGDRCRIGANAVVYESMPPDSVAVCAPTRVLQRENLENTYTTTIGGVSYRYRDGALRRAEEQIPVGAAR
ncbi:MAG: serine acetyltransferase [Oscillospiraceae bacterium]